MPHLVGKKNYNYPDEPKKDATTDAIVRVLADFYKKYRVGHRTNTGETFHTYYGEIIDPVFNRNEEAYMLFCSIDDTMRISVRTEVNFSGETESSLLEWMNRANRGFILQRLSGKYNGEMKKLPNFPGKGHHTINKFNQNITELSFDYYGPYNDKYIPSLDIGATIKNTKDNDIYFAAWNMVLEKIAPLKELHQERG